MVFKQDGSIKQKSFNLGNNDFIKEISMTVSDKVIEIFGFYGDFTYINELINGFFTFSFDENLNQKTKTQNEFSKTLTDEAYVYKKKGQPVLFNFYVSETIKKADGSTLILAEHVVITKFTRRDGSSIEYFIHGNILYINLNEKYEVKDIKSTSKVQMSSGKIAKRYSGLLVSTGPLKGYTHSFTTFSYDNTTYLLYNDVIKNKDIIAGTKVKAMKNGANAALFAVNSDENGNLSKKLVYEKHPDKLELVPFFVGKSTARKL